MKDLKCNSLAKDKASIQVLKNESRNTDMFNQIEFNKVNVNQRKI